MRLQYFIRNPMAHCSTICQHGAGVLIAYYIGPECSNKQIVEILYLENDEVLASRKLYPKTGNCVLCPGNDGTATLIYSYFNDTDGQSIPTTPVHRWMYCSNWKIKVSYSHVMNKIQISSPEVLVTQPPIGYLVRCNPIKAEGQWLLPIYKEKYCYGMILASPDGWNWRTAGVIGLTNSKNRLTHGKCIQPTIWYDGSILHSLSRSTGHPKAWYSYSTDLGETWSAVERSGIDNDNNSLMVISQPKRNPLLIWNKGQRRSNLMLARLDPRLILRESYMDIIKADELLKLNTGISGSYPNGVIIGDKLHLTYTDARRIAYHVSNLSDYD